MDARHLSTLGVTVGDIHGVTIGGKLMTKIDVCAGNRPDRGSHFALSRKGADFRQVLYHEKRAEQLNRRGYLDDDAARCH